MTRNTNENEGSSDLLSLLVAINQSVCVIVSQEEEVDIRNIFCRVPLILRS